MAESDAPALRESGGTVYLSGHWTLAALTKAAPSLRNRLGAYAADTAWDLSGLASLDTYGAVTLWRAWGRALPASAQVPDEYKALFARLQMHVAAGASHRPPRDPLAWVIALGQGVQGIVSHIASFVTLVGQLVIELAYVLRTPRQIPWLEISANLHKAGVRAMPVAALVAFLIGIVLSYLFALQLKRFGGEAFIVDVLGIGIIRELGPVLVAVLVAGRSGSAMTAQLGTMRVTEEIDALATMGVPRHLRLVFPKVVALGIAMPLLVAWTCMIALAGGMLAAHYELGLDYQFFISNLPRVVPLPNLWIAIAKGVVFGMSIAIVACHYGLRVQPNTESLSGNTTRSVVTAITLVILLDALFALATRNIGLGRG
ncbi:ABC transporter permease [Niveibacterium sp. 24ML]|uniref:MlaE family ABC transporter permease n=1 Tax=Niveibacterium sp. 24ML TaxID=2985512 RepID=UPI0022706AEB|nr:ABC transporter permease [Niveibacterium sp. 24ML]MCX9156710.1 ABC transporter permease [Niveibacterium sp. 24ML]